MTQPLSLHPRRHIFVGADEWEAHLAGVREAALTEATDALQDEEAVTRFAELHGTDHDGWWIGREERDRIALYLTERFATTSTPTAPSATPPADDAPPVPMATPGPQEPAETPIGGLDAIGMRSAVALLGAESDDFLNAYGTSWTAIRESLADVQALIARHRALRTERDNLALHVNVRDHALQLVDAHRADMEAQRDAARAAAETFRDELDRTGEQLLAMTTDRDDYRTAVLGLANSLADVKAERDRLAETLKGIPDHCNGCEGPDNHG